MSFTKLVIRSLKNFLKKFNKEVILNLDLQNTHTSSTLLSEISLYMKI